MTNIEWPDDDAIDLMARKIHENYLNARKAENDGSAESERSLRAVKPWDELDAKMRGLNRDQARDNIVKLADLGYRVVALSTEQAGDSTKLKVELTDDEIDTLARREHDRWMDQKMAQGYTYGPARIDEGDDKRHPDIKRYDELTERARQKDEEAMKQMIAVFEAVGFAVVPSD